MLPSRETRQAILEEYGIGIAVAVIGHVLLFSFLIFGAFELKKEPEKIKIPEFTALNLIEFSKPAPVVQTEKKPEPKKPEPKKPEPKKPEPKKPEPKKPEPKKPEPKKPEPKKPEPKKITTNTPEPEKVEPKKTLQEKLAELEAAQEALDLAELEDDLSDVQDDIDEEEKKLEEDALEAAKQQERYDQLTQREKAQLQKQKDQKEIVDNYGGVIKGDVELSWNKIQSRRPYTAKVEINLASTGEVINVRLISSNGDDAYTKSLMNAVESFDQFDVPDDPFLFVEHFKQLIITFGEG